MSEIPRQGDPQHLRNLLETEAHDRTGRREQPWASLWQSTYPARVWKRLTDSVQKKDTRSLMVSVIQSAELTMTTVPLTHLVQASLQLTM